MKLSLFDLHCDTAYEMLRQKQAFGENTLAVSLQKAEAFEAYIQVMAHWTDSNLDDENGWIRFEKILRNLKSDPSVKAQKACLSTACPPKEHPPALLLSVEDARILAGRIRRVDRLYEYGIRILTPLWKGLTCIGGSHDTKEGLTDFGKNALEYAVTLGIILDISHASEASAKEILEISQKHRRPVMASHSNAYEICPVSRNLKKEQIKAVIDSDGIIGINLHQPFLNKGGKACMEDVFSHIEYFLEQNAERHLGLGCDMDGCDLPDALPDLAHLPRLAEEMAKRNYPESLIQNIFYQNAYSFAQKYLA